jgi:hypothetical protein
MSFALGATSSTWDVQQSLRAQSGTARQTTASAFEPIGDVATPESTATACSSGSCSSPLSSQTLGALIAAQKPPAIDPSISLPPAPQNTIRADPQAQIREASPSTVTNADGSKTTTYTVGRATITVTTPASASAGSGGSSTDPKGWIAPKLPTIVTNADGSRTTSITWPNGTKVTVTIPAPPTRATSVVWPNFSGLSHGQIEQRIQSEAQSLSSFASASLAVNA